MSVQTTYSINPAVAFSGQKADTGNDDCLSFVNGEASAEIRFGAVVCQGTAVNEAILPVDANSEALGIVVHSHAYHKTQELGTTGLKPNVPMSVMRKGRIWVLCRSGCTAGDRLYARHDISDGGTEFKGAPEDAADASDMLDLSNQGRWMTTASAGEIALLEVDFTSSPTVA